MNKKVKQLGEISSGGVPFSMKAILLFCLTWGTIEGFYWFDPYAKQNLSHSYNAAIIDKYKRLKSLPSPKIVLIAGSNFAYGINSQMIEQVYKKPVMNMALHYDYGTNFMLNQISPEMHAGDTVIMGFEYIISSKGNLSEKILMTRVFPKAQDWFTYKDIFEYIGKNAQVRISNFKLILQKLQKKSEIPFTVEDTTSVFFRKAFNKYGDLISHYNNPPLKTIPRSIINDKVSFKEPIADMNLFYKKMKAIGVKVYYTYPVYAESSYKYDQKIIEKLDKELQNQALFPILGKPSDFVFPDSLCQDMVFHLTKKGGEIRTQKIIDLLKRHENLQK
jgi:hypothetical protein